MIMAPDKDKQGQQERVYTIEEITKILRVSDGVVRKLIASGELKSKQVGRQHRITQSMLDEYLNSK